MKTALVLGTTGQDGSYLTEILLNSGLKVYGLIRKASTDNTQNIKHLIDSDYFKSGQFQLIKGDLLDNASIFQSIAKSKPDYIYNEADQDHVAWSYEIPSYSISTTTTSVVNIMEAIRVLNPEIKFFQPVSSNIFGIPSEELQNENTFHNPVSPYGIAKSATFHLCNFYRNSYNLKVSTAILYNHESPRRPEEYLSRKVTMAVAKIKAGIQDELILGDLNGYVDWGYAKDFMEIAKVINESEYDENYVVGTGVLTRVGDFVDKAFKQQNLEWEKYVKSSIEFKRPVSTGNLRADISKLKSKLGIEPKVKIDELISIMLESDIKSLEPKY
jgi:GDPmannose 4,6-dehydratase